MSKQYYRAEIGKVEEKIQARIAELRAAGQTHYGDKLVEQLTLQVQDLMSWMRYAKDEEA